ncbi:TNF receptor-associated factor 1 [Latimeria chalumnae]|nr:PREDICTED: TNF receptor-associated factor 1-like [Latimeria chalumnae]|eukprot:XP_005987434.1 PREDICTED: TNF receptor-associated factor 1-like [Latimeria chalumnae]
MAEKPNGEQNMWSSSPDENEFPSGYPANICEDMPEQKYLCCNCKSILKKAQQTFCGHRYCLACLSWLVRNNKNPICQKCKEDNPEALDEDSLLSVERAFSDAAIGKEISELKVHCGNSGCSWSSVMKNYEDHQNQCEHALIPCSTGCGHMVVRRKLPGHLENECVNNLITCQKCSRKMHNREYQKHTCGSRPPKDKKTVKTDPASREKNRQATGFRNKDECRFSEIGCLFKGSKEKIKEHEQNSLVAHLGLLLQFLHLIKENSCLSNGVGSSDSVSFSPQQPARSRQEKSLLELKSQEADEFNGCLEVDGLHEPSGFNRGLKSQEMLVCEQKLTMLDNKVRVFENIVSVLNREVEKSNITVAAFERQSRLDQDTIASLEQKIADLQRSFALKETAVNRLHLHFLSLEQATYDGIFLWKITDLNRKHQDAVTGRNASLLSPAFYTARYGYKVCMRIYLNGDGAGKGTHISLFFVIMKGNYDVLLSWPFRHKVTFMLLDQNNREHVIDAFRPDLTSVSFQRPVNDMNVASGCPLFLHLSKLQSPKHAYMKDDALFIKCIIDTSL